MKNRIRKLERELGSKERPTIPIVVLEGQSIEEEGDRTAKQYGFKDFNELREGAEVIIIKISKISEEKLKKQSQKTIDSEPASDKGPSTLDPEPESAELEFDDFESDEPLESEELPKPTKTPRRVYGASSGAIKIGGMRRSPPWPRF